MENLKKTQMKKDYQNHMGRLQNGEMVIVLSVNEENQEAKIIDCFDREWNVPVSYVKLN